MLTAEEQMVLEILKKHGSSIRELAKATGHLRNTVRRYLQGGDAAVPNATSAKASSSPAISR